MSIKIAINGFGRIGRASLKAILNSSNNLELKAINDLADVKTLAHLFKYDTVYGKNKNQIEILNKQLVVNQKKIAVFSEKDPQNLPWKELGIDIVLECTGFFREKVTAEKHCQAGAKRVLISAPPKDSEIPTYVLGVNDNKVNFKKDLIISNGSCTTNCLAPLVKVLNDHFKVKQGFITTIHSYTSNQNILDAPHKDLRRARAAAENMIPTTTGATQSVTEVIPELKGKLDGMALRVPTPDVSVIDLVALLKKNTSREEINNVFKEASQNNLKGILAINKEPLVSRDFIGSPFSAILDADLTKFENNLAKIIAWYDNEYGYACRLIEMAEYLGKNI